uniref:Small ribosomal subunit protein mS31 n=1 Tax=Paramormyrops kingsleyae TaxID=1676925 RepID=A0A3B3R7M8_9TELE|nr:28S ribosomal protein S31, mitochondrial [Paramormyrops kingsleyae]
MCCDGCVTCVSARHCRPLYAFAMYRRVFLSLSHFQQPVVFPQDACIYSPKCISAATPRIFRAAAPCGYRGLSTGSVLCSEIKDEPPPLKTKEKAQEERAEETSPQTGRSGKEKLLALLGDMKVQVTTKRRARPMAAAPGPVQKRPEPRPGEMESTISMFQEATAAGGKRDTLNPALVAAASAAAASLPDGSRVESELLQQLRKHEAVVQAQAGQRADGRTLGNIIANMKVGRRGHPNQQGARRALDDDEDDGAAQRHAQARGVGGGPDGERKRRSQLTGKRLNIFSKTAGQDAVAAPTLTLWDLELANAIAVAVKAVPRNGFEEMIQWTKEGKLWRYPIDNEAGLEEEAHVPFHEHVFLERHLEDGFPKRGPVRHFMELVVLGLAKNPYVTVNQKVQHIAWFRDYFRAKEDILSEAGALQN